MMKKLFVLVLSAIMLLSMAGISMAAVTIGGELNYSYFLSQVSDNNKVEIPASYANAKLTVSTDLNKTISAFLAFKVANPSEIGLMTKKTISESWVPYVDEAYITLKNGAINTKVGLFRMPFSGDVDILANDDLNMTNLEVLPGDYKMDPFAVYVSGQVAEGLTIGAVAGSQGYLGDDPTNIYGVSVAYDSAVFGGSLYYVNSNLDGFKPWTILNGYYNLKPVKLYLSYFMAENYTPLTAGLTTPLTDDDDNPVDWNGSAVIGAAYDSDTFFARVEYQAVKPDIANGMDACYGARLGYKLGNGAQIEYDNYKVYTFDNISYLKLKVLF